MCNCDSNSYKNENSIIVCRCEEVTKKEVIDAIEAGARTLDDIKRATRAGMGLCQSKTCYTIIQRIISEQLGVNKNDLRPMKIRIPVRPIRAEVLSED